jgi:nucleoside-diphosphate-sugar epimerase
MRIFVAGATGAVGQYLVPALVAAGHSVIGTTRSAAKQILCGDWVRSRSSPTASMPTACALR